MPTVPAFDHIFVIIMENHSASQIIGSADAPFIGELAASYGLAANYTAISHPSLPNYLALTGGSTFGLSTDCTDCFQNAPNIAVDRVAASGRAWRAYMGNEVATLVIARDVPAGFTSQVPYNHYSLLRTIETAWGLAPFTANDAAATAMSDFFPEQ